MSKKEDMAMIDDEDVATAKVSDEEPAKPEAKTDEETAEEVKNWLDEASKFYQGKKTKLAPDDEVGQEMWRSIQTGNKRISELEMTAKEAEALGMYRDDLQRILADPFLRPLVVRRLLPDLAEQHPELISGEVPAADERAAAPESDRRYEALESEFSAVRDHLINTNFENHLKDLQGKYPDADFDEVRTIARAQGVLSSPKAPDLVEQIVRANHERQGHRKKQWKDEYISSLRAKGEKVVPAGGISNSTRGSSVDFRGAFDKAFAEF